jgi:hypothetical protein
MVFCRPLVIPSLSPRMSLIVYLGEMLKIKMRINLGCGDAGVS